jgi:hypothetical protein
MASGAAVGGVVTFIRKITVAMTSGVVAGGSAGYSFYSGINSYSYAMAGGAIAGGVAGKSHSGGSVLKKKVWGIAR